MKTSQADVPYGLVSETTTDPKGNTVEKWYDSLDKIYKVIDGNDVTVYNYYENDKLSSVTVPGGTTTSYTYDEEGNLLTLTNKKSDGTVLDSFTYTYSDDTLGVKNQISKTETVGGVLKGTTSYEYDGLGRLTKTVTPDGVQNVYTYDGAGNRLTKTSTAGEESAVTEYTYDEQNRLLNTSAYVTGGTDEVNTYYGYDNNGNQISRWTQTEKTSGTEDAVTLSELGINAADETAVYEYDVFNRLTAIYQGDTIIENTYDGAGDNISRAENGVPVYYVYDGNTVILELDGNGAEKARNVYGRNLIARESDGEKAIYRYNGHGDVIALNAPNGDMIAEYAYDEFGQVIEEQAAPQATPMVDIDFSVEGSEEYDFPEDAIFDNPYRYAGYEYLDEVELYDLNARYYDPSIARFLTEDPYYNLGNRVMGVYEINVPNVYSIMQANALYAYCGNSPITFFDPSGYLEEADLNILTEDDLARIRALTAEYEYYEEQGNTAVMEAIRRCAVEIRSQDIYDDKYNIGKYEDTYEYTTTETSDIYVNAMVMDRGYAWLIGGSNDKNDDILSLMESADVSGVTNFFDALLALVLISKYDRVKKVLSEGDVEIRIENREGDSDEKFTKTAYYLRDGTFVVSETNYYLSGNGVFHEINPDIEVPGWIESVL